MKALLYKDFAMLKKTISLMMVIVLIFSFSMPAFACVYGAILPLTALSYDERTKWDQYAAAMPFSVRQIVMSKYVFGWILTVFSTLLALVINRIFSALPFGSSIVSFMPGSEMLISGLVGLCFPALILPPMFYFGTEKARLMMIVVMAAFFGSAGAMNAFSFRLDPGFSAVQWLPVILLLVVAPILNVISITLSTRFYCKRHR